MNILIFTALYPAPKEYGIPNDTKVVHYYARQWKDAGHNVHVIFMHLTSVRDLLRFKGLNKIFGSESDYEYEGIKVHLLDCQMLRPGVSRLSCLQAKSINKKISTFITSLPSPDKVFVHFPSCFTGIKSAYGFECPTMAVLHNVDASLLQKTPSLLSEIREYKNLGGRNKNRYRFGGITF